MSYSIHIGEARIADLDGEPEVRVDGASHPKAPVFPGDEMTGNGNGRHPAYGSWRDFVDKSGLTDLFFDSEEGLMRQHPGTFALGPEHVSRVRGALDRWKSIHPNDKPGWCECRECRPYFGPKEPPAHVELNATLARLIWLEWWMGWALRTCKRPAVGNT